MKLKKNNVYQFSVIEKGVNHLGKDYCIIEDIYSNTHYFPKKIESEFIKLLVKGSVKEKNNDKIKYLFSEVISPNEDSQKFDQFEIGNTYPFKFVGIESDKKNNEINVSNSRMLLTDLNDPKKKYSTKLFEWQLSISDHPEIILCEICEENNKIFLRQSIKNLTHPIFIKGKEYEFQIELKPNEDFSSPFVYAKGVNNQFYRLVRPYSEDNLLNRVKYIFNGFNSNGSLLFRQFVPFEKIVKYRALKRLTYSKFRDIDNNPIISKMFEDYDNKENLWIISFCNILEDELEKSLDALEYEQALIYVEVLVEFENWILNSGFLNSFRDSTISLESARFKLREFETKKLALEIILNGESENYLLSARTKKDIDSEYLKILSEILTLSYKFIDISTDNIINVIINLGCQDIFRSKSLESGAILGFMQKICFEKEKSIFELTFTNAHKRDRYFVNNNKLEELIKFNFIVLLIYNDRANINNLNLNLIKHFRYTSLHTSSKTNRFNLIQNALFIAFMPELMENYVSNLSWLKFNDLLKTDLKLFDYNKRLLKPSTLYADFQSKTEIKTNILDENKFGYVVKVHGNNSILPKKTLWESFFQNINSNPEREIFVIIQHIDEYFGNVIVYPASRTNIKEFEYTNIIEVGKSVIGYVKRIEDYGAFINLGEIDGLLHNSKMGHSPLLLSLGQKISLKIEEVNLDNDKKLVSLIQEYNEKPIVKNSIYRGVITKVYDYGIFISISNNFSGLIRKENISFQEIFFNTCIKEKDIVNAELLNISKIGKYEFSIKSNENNPFTNQKRFLNKTFQGTVIQITPLLITVKFKDYQLLGFHILEVNNGINHHLEIEDLLTFSVTSINTENQSILIDIDFNNIFKTHIHNQNEILSTKLALEIGTCYEHFAYLMTKNDDKLNHLSIAQTFYGLASSAKSYYLNIFINYQRIINGMSVTKNDIANFENIIKMTVLDADKLISEIKEQNLTIQIFPAIEVVQKTLEILTCFGIHETDNMKFLFAISALENYDFDIIEKTARLVLAYNLISHDLQDESLKIQRWKQLQQYLKEGLLIVENEDENDIKKRADLFKIIDEGENYKNEFKASLFKPVHDEKIREVIECIKVQLQIALENEDKPNIEILQAKIEDKQNQGSVKGVKHTAMKNLVAFANTQGGNLIIGLEDNLNILGVEYELNSTTFSLKDQDKYLNDLDGLIDQYIGNDFHQYIESIEFIKTENGHLLWIKIKKSNKPIFLRLDKNGSLKKDFYIRGRVSSRILDIEEYTNYFSENYSL